MALFLLVPVTCDDLQSVLCDGLILHYRYSQSVSSEDLYPLYSTPHLLCITCTFEIHEKALFAFYKGLFDTDTGMTTHCDYSVKHVESVHGKL